MIFKCCGALAYAFNEGIVHRDIKPANIMIAQGTEVKIADFGAALLRKAHAVQTASIGSPYYMSPEQIEDAPLTHHSDMYCLGVVLYELLPGASPDADTLEVLVQKVMHRIPLRQAASVPSCRRKSTASCCARSARSPRTATLPGPSSRANSRSS
jgi:serine/threonine protein kinase